MIHSELLTTLSGYWAGEFHQATTADTFDVVDPASGERLATLPRLGEVEAVAAIEAARVVLDVEPPLHQRADWLSRIASSLTEARDELARIITLENGKPLAESRGEVDYAAAFYLDAAKRVPQLKPHRLAEHPRDHVWEVHHRPAGIAGLITPWNFPLGMLAKKLAGAIAAGCPSVVKPAELTPLSCIAFFALLDRLGLPPGLVNLVFGDAPAIGQVLCRHPDVRVISFTGSTAVGKQLALQCAPHVKRISMELGGNAPFVVCADANLDAAVQHLMANKFRCAGQTCVCTNRVLVEQSIAATFAERVRDEAIRLSVGPGLDEGTQIGPLINRAGFDKVQRLVDDAVRKGARVMCGGATPGDTRFFAPMVLADVTADMACTHEELFGPVVAVSTFRTDDEAVQRANDTEYGLAAYVFCGDVARAKRMATRLRFGHVGINTAAGPTPEAPFGGMKQSGIGREGALEGIMEFVELQTIPTPA